MQKELDEFVQQWNTQYIHRSCADCLAGRPDDLYDVPENYGNILSLISHDCMYVVHMYITYMHNPK